MGGRRVDRARVARVALVLISLAFGAYVVSNDRAQLLQAADQLTGVRPAWAALAAGAELVSFVAAGASLCLLARRRLRLLGTTAALAGQAAGNCLPGGGAVTAAVVYRELRREGVPGRRAARASVTTSVVQALTLPLLALVVIRLTPSQSRVPGLEQTSADALLGAAALALVALLLHRRGRLLPLVRGTSDRGRALLVRLRLVRPRDDTELEPAEPLTAASASALAGLSSAYWAFDALCLVAAFPAIGSHVPWTGLFVGYVAAQVAAVLPFVPGGLGVVEGSLTLALVEFGDGQQEALAAVLLYRIISYWLVILVGGALALTPVRRQGAVAGPDDERTEAVQ